MTYDDETFTEIDGGVPSLPLLDAQVASGAFNPFAPAFSKGSATIGGVTYKWDNAAALQATKAEARWVGTTHNRDYVARISGPVFELPAGSLQFAGGVEFQDQEYQQHVDDLYLSGSVLGLPSNSNDHRESYQRALFGEIQIPLISEKNNIPFVHELAFGALARNESQTLKGDNAGVWTKRKFKKTNPSLNLRYAPMENILVRSTWSKGFLTPSTSQLFTTIQGDTPTLVDPLGFPYTTQTSIQIRGNPNLQPAVSEAWSAGVVIEPKQFVKGLSFSVDYYNVSVNNIVANNAQQILNLNAAGQGSGFVAGNAATINPNAPFASQIRRSANGRLNSTGSFAAYPGSRGAVLSDYLNIGSREVEGLEYSATYVYNTSSLGQFRTTLALNQFLKYAQTAAPGLPSVNFLGRFVSTVGDRTSPGAVPRWKGNVVTQWTWKNFTTNVGLNYVDSYQDDPLFVLSPKMQAFYNAGTPKSDAAFSAFLADVAQNKVGGYRRISSFTTLDLQTTYAFKTENRYLKGLSVTLGATNLFDKLAPFSAGAFNDNYDTRTVSNVGRFVYTSVHKQF